MRVMDFSVDRRRVTVKYGDRLYLVGLPDGREFSMLACDIKTDCGALEVLGKSPDGEVRIVLALAPGAWTHAYAASVLDESPVVVEYLEGPR